MSIYIFSCVYAYIPFGPAGRLDHGRHAISVQALGLGEVDNVKNDPLKEKHSTQALSGNSDNLQQRHFSKTAVRTHFGVTTKEGKRWLASS